MCPSEVTEQFAGNSCLLSPCGIRVVLRSSGLSETTFTCDPMGFIRVTHRSTREVSYRSMSDLPVATPLTKMSLLQQPLTACISRPREPPIFMVKC